MRKRSLFGYFFLFLVSGLVLFGVATSYVLLTLPDVTQLKGCMTTTMYKVKLCPGTPSYVRLKDVAPTVAQAIIASEDAAFFSHNGFDWHEIRESFNANWETGEIKRGGSTLTQQLAKNVFLSQEKSYLRKLREAYIAMALEKQFSKNEILEKYLNVVEFAPNVYGVKAAAQHYFGKHPRDLHLLESVFLAFLLPNPKTYSQSHRKGQLTPFAQKMHSIILNRLVQFKKISPGEYRFALSQIQSFPWGHLSPSAFAHAASESSGEAPVEDIVPDDPDALEALIKSENETEAEFDGSDPYSGETDTGDSEPVE